MNLFAHFFIALLLFILFLAFCIFLELKQPFSRFILARLTPYLRRLKQKSLAHDSPFEQTPNSLWIAESENAYALKDIRPRAPIHYLVIPKQRISSLLEASPELLAEMSGLCQKIAVKEGFALQGFRVVINTNPEGLQTIYHLHMHVLAGRQMGPTIG